MIDLRIPEDLFWDLTIEEFTILSQRHVDSELSRREHTEGQTALMCFITARCAGNKKAQLKDFMPPPRRMKKHSTHTQPMSDEDFASTLRTLNLMFGGEERD